MAELLLLGPEVSDVAAPRRHLERHALDDVDAVALQPGDLARVVGQEPDALDAEIAQDLRADPVVARILLEPELQVGLDGVPPAVLERLRPDLVREPDAASLLVHVDEHALPGRFDAGKGLP